VGAPNETKRDIQETLNFSRKLAIDIPQINILGAFPGNHIWEELKDKGFLNEDRYWETGVRISDIYRDAVPINEIRQMIHNYYKNFLIQPCFLTKQILLSLRSTYRLNVLFNNLSRIGIITDNINSFISTKNFSERPSGT